MKKYDLYSKRDPAKNFSPLPNEVFYLGLSYGAIAVYGYLMHIEDRRTFQSYAGYNTIGRAVKMSANTVRKYVLELDTERQKAQPRLSQLCAAQEPLPAAERPMTPPAAERGVSGLCGPVCEVGGLSDFQNGQVSRGVEKSAG